jgi:hypothetical protein
VSARNVALRISVAGMGVGCRGRQNLPAHSNVWSIGRKQELAKLMYSLSANVVVRMLPFAN